MVEVGILLALMGTAAVWMAVTLLRRRRSRPDGVDGHLIEQEHTMRAARSRAEYSSIAVHNTPLNGGNSYRP
ncbi:hypothetical protein ACM614_18130 [Streptomyces sp. 12297]